MADSDFNSVKPVENLPTVAALNSTGQRQERRRRQNPRRQEATPRARQSEEDDQKKPSGPQDDGHMIDYCA
jgi:hypothetical protein